LITNVKSAKTVLVINYTNNGGCQCHKAIRFELAKSVASHHTGTTIYPNRLDAGNLCPPHSCDCSAACLAIHRAVLVFWWTLILITVEVIRSRKSLCPPQEDAQKKNRRLCIGS